MAESDLVSSPLCRAIETARLVSGRSPEIAPQLNEMDWGKWQGLRGVDLLADASSGYRHIDDWGWDFQPPGGETPRAVWRRIRPWISALRATTVTVCHIGVMRVILARATGWKFSGPAPFQVKRDRLYIVSRNSDDTLTYDHEPVRLVRRKSR